MKTLTTLGICTFLLGCAPKHSEHGMNMQHEGHDHGASHDAKTSAASLMVSTRPTQPTAGNPVDLRMMIHLADGTMVHDFDILHEEKAHLAIISEDLRHFAHVHPSVDSTGNLKVTHSFPVGGRYRLFVDYKPAGGEPATASAGLNIEGPAQAPAEVVATAPGEIIADGLRASIAAGELKAGQSARLAFTLQNDRGEPVTLDQYMGELGHLMLVGVGTWQYVHVHPVGGDAGQGTVTFEAHFAEPGLYKGWGQFKHRGTVKVIPFVVKVE